MVLVNKERIAMLLTLVRVWVHETEIAKAHVRAHAAATDPARNQAAPGATAAR